jgi:hypothetical protein
MAGPTPSAGQVAALDQRIARVERGVDLVALLVGLGWWLLGPGPAVAVLRPSVLVWGAVTLLGAGLLRDLAWFALGGRRRPHAREGVRELRLCLESSLGLLALATGLAWRAGAPGPLVSVSLGGLVLGAAAVATFGQLTRNVIVALRIEPGHGSLTFRS